MKLGLFKKLIYIVFPKSCYFCNEVISVEDRLCPDCLAYPPCQYTINRPHCKSCGAGGDLCTCKKKSMFYGDILAPYYYVHPLNTAVWLFKYHDKPKKAEEMAKDMAKTLQKTYPDLPFDLICYVPQSKDERKNRGYNQSELLAQELQKLIGVKVSNALIKLYDTPRQQSLSSSSRKGNVFGVFDLKNHEEIEGKNILLVDDIKTTGSTLNECAKMLKIYNANTVTALVFAITPQNKGDMEL